MVLMLLMLCGAVDNAEAIAADVVDADVDTQAAAADDAAETRE